MEPFWAKVFEKALKGKNVSDLFMGSAGGSGPAQGSAPVAQTAQETKKEERKVFCLLIFP